MQDKIIIMKKLFLLTFIFSLITSCNDHNFSSSGIFNLFSGKRILIKELVKDGGLFYHDGKPFNGIAFQMYDEKNIQFEKSFKDGKQDGEEKYWYENGTLKINTNFKNGKKDGKVSKWHENGQLEEEGFYEDGYMNGVFKGWHENGNKAYVKEIKLISIDYSVANQYKKHSGGADNGKVCIINGKCSAWHENGQLKEECFFNEKGNADGSWTWWNSDGSVSTIKSYKDGDLISWSGHSIGGIRTGEFTEFDTLD